MYTQAMEPFDFLFLVSGAFQEIFTLPRSVFFSGLPQTLFWWLAVVEIPVQITCSDSTKQSHCVSLDRKIPSGDLQFAWSLTSIFLYKGQHILKM